MQDESRLIQAGPEFKSNFEAFICDQLCIDGKDIASSKPLQLDSLELLDVLTAIDESYGVRFTEEDLRIKDSTVGSFVDAIFKLIEARLA